MAIFSDKYLDGLAQSGDVLSLQDNEALLLQQAKDVAARLGLSQLADEPLYVSVLKQYLIFAPIIAKLLDCIERLEDELASLKASRAAD